MISLRLDAGEQGEGLGLITSRVAASPYPHSPKCLNSCRNGRRKSVWRTDGGKRCRGLGRRHRPIKRAGWYKHARALVQGKPWRAFARRPVCVWRDRCKLFRLICLSDVAMRRRRTIPLYFNPMKLKLCVPLARTAAPTPLAPDLPPRRRHST